MRKKKPPKGCLYGEGMRVEIPVATTYRISRKPAPRRSRKWRGTIWGVTEPSTGVPACYWVRVDAIIDGRGMRHAHTRAQIACYEPAVRELGLLELLAEAAL